MRQAAVENALPRIPSSYDLRSFASVGGDLCLPDISTTTRLVVGPRD